MIRRCDANSSVVRSLLAELSDAYRAAYGASDVDPTDLDAALVAFDGQRAVGVIGWRALDATTAHLRRLYVVDGARGRGWASRLADAAIAAARLEGYQELLYDVDQENRWCRRKGEQLAAIAVTPFAPHVDEPYVRCYRLGVSTV